MPIIEMILVRFNLDKEDDRKAFELLRKHSAPRKRNAFIKKALLQGLAIELGEKPVARMTRKASKGTRQGELDNHRKEAVLSDMSRVPQLSPGDGSQIPAKFEAGTAETDTEVAELIGSIVQ